MNDKAREMGEGLRRKGWTISVAESCTAGGLAHEITRIPGSSTYFFGGIIAYDNAVKTSHLGVPAADLERFGAVSPETAEAMASACRRSLSTDLAVSITGIAGPGGGTDEKPVGLVYIAVASESGVYVRPHRFFGDRESIRSQAIDAALDGILAALADSGNCSSG